jgi:hypothetical protein
MSISRIALRDKVTLRPLKLYFNIADLAECSRALDLRVSDWYCSGVSSNPVEGRMKNCHLIDTIFEITKLVVIVTNCICSCNFNYHTMTSTAIRSNYRRLLGKYGMDNKCMQHILYVSTILLHKVQRSLE